MINFINKIFNFLSGLSKEQLLIALCVLSLVFSAYQYVKKNEFKQKYQASQSNIAVLTDSLETYINKNGDLVAERSILQTDKEELKTLNKNLSEDLEAEKGRVSFLQKLLAEAESDTVYIDTTTVEQTPEGQYTLSWEYENRGDRYYRYLEGYVSFYWDSVAVAPIDIQSVIEKDILQMELITGIREREGRPYIFARSTYPGLEFTNIEGALLNPDWFSKPKPDIKRWGIGVQGGYGLLFREDIVTGPYIGVGVSYNFIRF